MRQPNGHDNGSNTKLKPLQIGENGLFVMRDQMDVYRVANHLLETGAVPATLRNAQQVSMAVQALNSLKLNPYASIRHLGFINGALTLWGDLPLALARQSPDFEDMEEFRFTLDKERNYVRQCFENNNAHAETFGVVCRIKRRGQRLHEVIFTQEDARRAMLWNKTPTWQRYPARMMQMRARGQALKDVFADALAGAQIHEYDVEGIIPQGSGTLVPLAQPSSSAPNPLPPAHDAPAAPRRRGRPPGKVARPEAVAEADAPAQAPAEPMEAPGGRRVVPVDDGHQQGQDDRVITGGFSDEDLDGLEDTTHLQGGDSHDEDDDLHQAPLTRTQRLTQRVNAGRQRR